MEQKIILSEQIKYRWIPISAQKGKGQYSLVYEKNETGCLSKINIAGVFAWEDIIKYTAVALRADSSPEFIIRMGVFFKSLITIREYNRNEKIIAKMKLNADSEGVLEFSNGSKFKWTLLKLLKNEWGFTDANDHTVLRFTGISPAERGAEITLLSEQLPMLHIFLFIGWYLMLLFEDRGTIVVGSSFGEPGYNNTVVEEN